MNRKELEAMADAHKNEIFKNAETDWISLGKDVCNDDIISDAFIAGFLAGRDAAAVIPVNITPISKGSDAGVVLKKVYQKIKALGEEK